MSIKIEQLLPLLKKGWVAMDEDETWWWHERKPTKDPSFGNWASRGEFCDLDMFDIEPIFYWANSVMRCGNE